MKTFYMKLDNGPFKKIKNKSKTIELRLNDEKRRQIAVGDVVVFSNAIQPTDTVTCVVSNLYRFDSFEQLYQALPLTKCGYDASNVRNAKPCDMEKYYDVAQQHKYGVVGIELILQ